MLALLKRLIQFHEWAESSRAFLLQVRVVWSVLCSREIRRATWGPRKAFLVSLDQPSVPPGTVITCKPGFYRLLQVSPCLVHLSVYPSCAQSCPTLCNPVNARLLCPRDSPAKNTGVGCHFLLQGIFLTQGSNSCLRHCKWILYCLSHWEAPYVWSIVGTHWPIFLLNCPIPTSLSPLEGTL